MAGSDVLRGLSECLYCWPNVAICSVAQNWPIAVATCWKGSCMLPRPKLLLSRTVVDTNCDCHPDTSLFVLSVVIAESVAIAVFDDDFTYGHTICG